MCGQLPAQQRAVPFAAHSVNLARHGNADLKDTFTDEREMNDTLSHTYSHLLQATCMKSRSLRTEIVGDICIAGSPSAGIEPTAKKRSESPGPV